MASVLRQQRLAGAGRADEQDVALLELDVVAGSAGVDALVVVVDGDGEDLLGLLLADDVLAQLLVEQLRRRDRAGRAAFAFAGPRCLFLDDLAAQLDALVADVDGAGPGDQPLDLILVLAAERAVVLQSRSCGSRPSVGPPRCSLYGGYQR